MMPRLACVVGTALLPVALAVQTARPAAKAPAGSKRSEPSIVRVRLETSRGPILLALDARRAPGTTANFLRYVDDGRLDGTTFFRSARSKANPARGFVEGGIGTDARRTLLSIPIEPTSKTGLHHIDGAISMARSTPDSATGNFSIFVGAAPGFDARPGNPGYAVFGRVIGNMATVKTILAESTGGGTGVMKGQMILKPVIIRHAVRLDGTPKPTKFPRTWLFNFAQ